MSNAVSIQISNLTKKFGGFTAVNNLNFSIYKNEIFGFLGPNGAGKTTTISMIYGLTKPSKGTIEINGKKLSTDNKLIHTIGICPQENVFWPKLTILEQLLFLSKMYGINPKKSLQNARELISLTELESKAKTIASKLSGGMKRRLSICLALIHDPSILILDEPEAGLDPHSRILIRDFIKSLSKNKTVIITTHNMDEADRISDRIGIINKGELIRIDSPENLKKSTGQGDVLEVFLENDWNISPQTFENLEKKGMKINVFTDKIIVRGNNLIEQINTITSFLSNKGIKIKKMTLRENTLEDVFIHLTGDKLIQ